MSETSISRDSRFASGGRSVRRACVVFALSPEERRLFLGEDAAVKAPVIDWEWLDTTGLTADAWHEQLRALRPTVLVTGWSCPAIPLEWGMDAQCPLKYVCSITGSVKHLVPREMIENGLLVTNWGSLPSWAVAEHALLMILALLRSLPLWGEFIARPRSMFQMQPVLRPRTLRGRRVGLHGFGAVARDLVSMLAPYEVKVAAYSDGVPETLMDEFGVRPCADLAELFSQSEVLIECEGLTPRSRGSVTENLLRLLPEDAVFVNVGRGAVVDEAALARLAHEGRLRIGLDVFEREPLPADSPLRSCSGVLLSPHVAGPTWENYPECGRLALENVERYLRDEKLERVVTLEVFDRAT